MVLKLIKRALGLDKDSPSGGEAATAVPAAAATASEGQASAVALVEYVVRELVESPDQVVVTGEERENQYAVTIRCAKPDMGKVIGRKGKTIAALRALAAGARDDGRKVTVDALD
ncbi:MAG: hypothetical protein BWZ02_02157 [Lentisphaerae bacterium ADurb.BinA184]|nr:MAG: hypothetical protein BWZ02_02157 [Lentisphaerae bacterium ADurb.BinA184]